MIRLQIFLGNAIDELGWLKLCQLRLFDPIIASRAVNMMVVDNPDEISKLHALIVLLNKILVGLGTGVGDDQEMMVIVMHLMQVLEIPAQQ